MHTARASLSRLSPHAAAALRTLSALSKPEDERNDTDREGVRNFLDEIEKHREDLGRDMALLFSSHIAGRGFEVGLGQLDMMVEGLEKLLAQIAEPPTDGTRLNTDKPHIKKGLSTFVVCWLHAMRHDKQERSGLEEFFAIRQSARIDIPGMIIDVEFTEVVTSGRQAAA